LEFNYLDIAVCIIILFFMVKGYLSGFVKMCFNFIPQLAGVVAAYLFSPTVSTILRNTFIYKTLMNGIRKTLNIDSMIENAASEGQRNVIETLNVPNFLKDSLMENNNPVAYELLDVTEIGEYIAGYIANVCINIISVIAVFAIVYIIFKVVLEAMDIVARLPIISMANTWGGILAGVFYGVFVIWIIGIIMVLFYSTTFLQPVFETLDQSRLAIRLYENNMLLFMVLKIFV